MLTPTICVGPVRSHWIPITISRCCWANPAPLANIAIAVAVAHTTIFVELIFIAFLPGLCRAQAVPGPSWLVHSGGYTTARPRGCRLFFSAPAAVAPMDVTRAVA